MDGKISEIIDNVLDVDDLIDNNKKDNINSVNSWNQLTYLDANSLKKPKPQIEEDKKETLETPNKINEIPPKKETKILNENLFKNKGFRSNIDTFLKSNEETLSLSGISDITSLSEYPNVFKCVKPRPGTKRYKRANKTFNESFYNNSNNNTVYNPSLTQSSIGKRTLPKIKNQVEERKNGIKKSVISAKDKSDNK